MVAPAIILVDAVAARWPGKLAAPNRTVSRNHDFTRGGEDTAKEGPTRRLRWCRGWWFAAGNDDFLADADRFSGRQVIRLEYFFNRAAVFFGNAGKGVALLDGIQIAACFRNLKNLAGLDIIRFR